VYIRLLKVLRMDKWTHKRKIMQRYDMTAEMYEMRYTEEQKAKYKAALDLLSIKPDSKILDVGCGTGLFFQHVATEAQAVVGADISIKLLRQAKKRAQEFCNVQLVQADADHLPFINNQFNIIFSFTVLQNLPKPLETLSEIKRNAQQTASIVVTGLKKAFSLITFQGLLQDAGLQVFSLKADDNLKCYVAVTHKN
jgi:ubiquinone/menaquinone biosynthesis C-methylase UbiE